MDNKTRIQNHNEMISDNNTSIDTLIEAINNLPEGGSGGSGKWQGFSALLLGTPNSVGGAVVEYANFPIELGKTYQVMVGNEIFGIPSITYTIECTESATYGGLSLEYVNSEGIMEFLFTLNYEMLVAPLEHCVPLDEAQIIYGVVLSIKEV